MADGVTLSTRVNKLEVVQAEHNNSINEIKKDVSKLEVNCDNFKEFMVEMRTESKTRDKLLNKVSTVFGIIATVSPIVTAWLISVINK